MFEKGCYYNRAEIHSEVGGSMEKYLPHVRGKVVCGCFRPDLNPDAPAEILPGNSADIMKWAATFARQKSPIPIFLKRDTNKWEYVGHWQVCSPPIIDPQVVEERRRKSGKSDVSMILRLKHSAE